MIPGALGFLWIIGWRALYRPIASHPRLSAADVTSLLNVLRIRACHQCPATPQNIRPGSDFLKLRRTWAIIAAKAFTDPGMVFRC